MRIKDLGCYVRVTVTRPEVYAFRRTWPCSDLPDVAVSFTFDRRNGDLIDVYPNNVDGSDALALSQDAQTFAREHGELS